MTTYTLIDNDGMHPLHPISFESECGETFTCFTTDGEVYERLTKVEDYTKSGYTLNSCLQWAQSGNTEDLQLEYDEDSDDDSFVASMMHGKVYEDQDMILRHNMVDAMYERGYTLPSVHRWVASGLPTELRTDPVRIITMRVSEAPTYFSEGYSLASVVKWIGCGDKSVLTKTTHPSETFDDRYEHFELLIGLEYGYHSIMQCLETGDTTLLTYPTWDDE